MHPRLLRGLRSGVHVSFWKRDSLLVCLFVYESKRRRLEIHESPWNTGRSAGMTNSPRVPNYAKIHLRNVRSPSVFVCCCDGVARSEQLKNPSGSAVCELPKPPLHQRPFKVTQKHFSPPFWSSFWNFSGSSWPHLPARMHRELLWCDWLGFYLC